LEDENNTLSQEGSEERKKLLTDLKLASFQLEALIKQKSRAK